MHFDSFLPSPFRLMITEEVCIDRIMHQNGPKYIVGCQRFILVTDIVQLPLTNMLYLVTSRSKIHMPRTNWEDLDQEEDLKKELTCV